MLTGIGKSSLTILDEQFKLLQHYCKNKGYDIDSCPFCEAENSEIKMFQDLVEEGANSELPQEKAERIKREQKQNTRQFLKNKYHQWY